MRRSLLGLLAAAVLVGGTSRSGGQTLPGELSVDLAVQIALQNNSGFKAAKFGADAVQVQAEREKPVAHPSLTLSADGLLQGPRLSYPRGAAGDAIVLPERYIRVGLVLEQLLYRPGLGAAKQRYASLSSANRYSVLRAQNDLVRDVRGAFYRALGARAARTVAQDGEALAEKHLQLTKDLLSLGMASERDVKAAEADQAEAKQGSTQAENGWELALGDLVRLLGREGAASASQLVDPADPILLNSPPTEESILHRPELLEIADNLRAARAGVELAGSQRGPSVTARAEAARQTGSAFVSPNYLAAGLRLEWNLLDRGKARLDTQEARSRVLQLEALLAEARLGFRLEAEKAWRDMRDAATRMATADRQIASAQAALDISEVRYRARSATLLEVSSARLGVTRARLAKQMARVDLLVGSAELERATAKVSPEAPTAGNPK